MKKRILAQYKTFSQELLIRPAHREVEALAAEKRQLYRITKRLHLIMRETVFQVRNHDLGRMSESLTYRCILALAPLLAVILFSFQKFGGMEHFIADQVMPFVARNFSDPVAKQMEDWISPVIKSFNPDILGAFAFGTFFFTVVRLFASIEKAFNDIFEAQTERSWIQRTLNYWTLLTLTPLIIAISSSKTAELLNEWPRIRALMSQLAFLHTPISIATQALGFAILFLVLPSRKPPIKAVIWGGLSASILFEILAFANVILTQNLMTGSAAHKVYGAAPVIIVAFLLWLQLVWLVILVSAALTVAIARIDQRHTQHNSFAEPVDSLRHCAHIFAKIVWHFRDNGHGLAMPTLVANLRVSTEEGERWITWLVAREMIFAVHLEDEIRYLPTSSGLAMIATPNGFIGELFRRTNSVASSQPEPADLARELTEIITNPTPGKS